MQIDVYQAYHLTEGATTATNIANAATAAAVACRTAGEYHIGFAVIHGLRLLYLYCLQCFGNSSCKYYFNVIK